MNNPRGEEVGKAIAEELSVAAKDPGKGHFYVSMVKSAIRLLGCGMLIGVGGWIAYAGVAFAIAEFLGIVEELVD